MNSTLGNVSRMLVANTACSVSPRVNPTRNVTQFNKKMGGFAKEVILGMADIIEDQRKFTKEFDLTIDKVFPYRYETLSEYHAKDVLSILFESGSLDPDEVEMLFGDLIKHQAAMSAGLDDVTEEDFKNFISTVNSRFEKLISDGLEKNYIQSIKNKSK